MKMLIVNGDIVTGDGESVLEKTSVLIRDGVIVNLLKRRYTSNDTSDIVVDAKDGLVIPGIVNSHTHGVTFGPLFPIATHALPRQRVISNLNRHLLQGETTSLSVDGFAAIWEAEAANKLHAINVRTSTSHTPLGVKVAQRVDGSGLEEWHTKFTADEMLKLGAVAIGEMWGATPPYAQKDLAKETGMPVSLHQARALVEAVSEFEYGKVKSVLQQIELEDFLTVRTAKKLIEEKWFPIIDDAKKALKEAATLAKKLKTPIIIHNDVTTKEILQQIAPELGTKLIAAHSNAFRFEVKEAVDHAKKLKKHHAVIDIYTSDVYGARQLDISHETTFALLEEGLVDIISTDYISGLWDPILLVLEKAIEEKVIDLPHAIALATTNPANAIPRLAPYRGLIAPGRIADVVITDREKISKVETVIIGGNVVVEDGKLR